MKIINAGNVNFVPTGDTVLDSFLSNIFTNQAKEELSRKFIPNTRVKFIGSVYDLANCIGDIRIDLDTAKAIFFDGAEGIVIGSNMFNEGIGYSVEFGNCGYHLVLVPEKFLKAI